jgi:hypothetical protein
MLLADKKVKSADTFINSALRINTYDKEKLLAQLDFGWNRVSSSYDTLNYYEAEYNTNNLITKQSTRRYPIISSYPGGITVFVSSHKYEYEYDGLDNTISFTSYIGDHKGNWTKKTKSFYYYDIEDLNINNVEVLVPKLFCHPNPSNGKITIVNLSSSSIINPEIKIYDILGRVVHQGALQFNNNQATLEMNLSSATYVLEIKDKGGPLYREKIVIQ